MGRDNDAVMRLAQKGQTVDKPEDILKNPLTLEFLGLKPEAVYSESKLETAIIFLSIPITFRVIVICDTFSEYEVNYKRRIECYFSRPLPFSVRRYFCFGCFGLSGYKGSTYPSDIHGFKWLFRKFSLSFSPISFISSLTE